MEPTDTAVEHGSGNVFADLGFPDAGAHLVKAGLVSRTDVTVNHLTSGGRVANLSVATNESYLDRQSGERVDKTEWRRIVTRQEQSWLQCGQTKPSGQRR